MKLSDVKNLSSVRSVRFITVGVLNTVLDFALFNILLVLFSGGDPSQKTVLIANSISATVIACFSFVMNRKYVFKAKKTPNHYAIYFILITLSGLYLVQNLVIFIITHNPELVNPLVSLINFIGIDINESLIVANIAKAIATVATMVWNYMLYKHFVFRNYTK